MIENASNTHGAGHSFTDGCMATGVLETPVQGRVDRSQGHHVALVADTRAAALIQLPLGVLIRRNAEKISPCSCSLTVVGSTLRVAVVGVDQGAVRARCKFLACPRGPEGQAVG